ncbi:ESAT-6-like protein EsxI [Mycobacterium marinum]|uniref:hypothetical protein n=1 Tax=Mycobacterium marinum TaxID=1781 RepID=UPI000ED4EC3D|nr:ESAT-6-like protein EsxI [Mycobacterium marinum]
MVDDSQLPARRLLWGGADWAAVGFITQSGRTFAVSYAQADPHGHKIRTAGSDMTQTDCAVGPGWA